MIQHYFKIAFRNILKYKTKVLLVSLAWQSALPALPLPTCGYIMK